VAGRPVGRLRGVAVHYAGIMPSGPVWPGRAKNGQPGRPAASCMHQSGALSAQLSCASWWSAP